MQKRSSIHNFLSGPRLPQLGQRGAMLISLIATMTMIALLGAGVASFTGTSTFGELLSNSRNRAYNLAQAGGWYAISLIKQGDTAKINALNDSTFTLAEGDRFFLRVQAATGMYIVESTGIVHQGAFQESRQKLVYRVPLTEYSPQGPSNPNWTPLNLASNWTLIRGGATVGSTGPSGGQQALIFTGTDSLISFKWQGSTSLPNLLTLWTDSGGLLSYQLQTKVNVDAEGSKGDHYMLGLSFRLNTATNSSYGLSYFRSIGRGDKKRPSWINDLPATFDVLMNGSPHVILWKRISGVYSLIDYRLLTSADNVLTTDNPPKLKGWSTLVVAVEERFSGPGGARQNHIAAYVQGTSVYPRGTINWNFANFLPVRWVNYPGFPARANNTNYALGSMSVPSVKNGFSYEATVGGVSAGSAPAGWPSLVFGAAVVDGAATWATRNIIIDGSLTSANFATALPPEIGIHGYYDANAFNDQFIDDFGVKILVSGATGGGIGGGGGTAY